MTSSENKKNPPLLRSDEMGREIMEQLRAVGADTSKIEKAVELEADVLMLKFMREEILSMMDEIREIITYEDLIASDFFLPENMPVPREKLEEILNGSGNAKEAEEMLVEYLAGEQMSEDDKEKVKTRFAIMRHSKDAEAVGLSAITMNLLVENWKMFSKAVVAAQYQKNKTTFGQNSKMNEKQVLEAAKAKTKGQRRLLLLLIKKSLNLHNAAEKILEEGGREKVMIFIKSVAKKIREVLKNLKTIKTGVDSAKAAKIVTGLYTEQETAQISGLDIEEIREIDELEAEMDSEIFGENTKKQTGSPRELHAELGNMVNTDALTAYVNYNKELKHMRALMAGGKIVETAYVKEVIEEAMVSLTKNPPTTVYLHGDYGTGKTAIAVHLARTRFHKEPIIVAGNKFLEPERFTEELKIEKRNPVDFVNDQLKEFGSDRNFEEGEKTGDMIGMLVGEKAKIIEQIIATRKKEQNVPDIDKSQKEEIKRMVDATFENQVQGRYVIGAMYKAMKEGRPLIIDEANAITPEVIIAFNDLMTKKIGEKIGVRSDEEEITVKEGYCVIWTGNTGGRYKDARYNDMDPASLSRIHPIKVGYLPQTVYTSSLSGVFEERLELDKLSEKFMDAEGNIPELKLGTLQRQKEVAKTDQIFQVLLAKLLNKRMGCRLLVKKDDPYSVFKDLYRLSAAARLIMNIFEERINPDDFPITDELKRWTGVETATDLIAKLRKTNLTMRQLLDKIVASYLNDNMAMDIEYYVFKFVKELDIQPEEMAIVYSVLNKYFFLGEGWREINTAGDLNDFKQKISRFNILSLPKYAKVDINGDYVSLLKPAGEEGDYEMRYFNSLETMQLIFGYLPPRKLAEYKEIADATDEENKKKDMQKNLAEREQEVRDALEQIREAFDPAKFFAGRETDKSENSYQEIENIDRLLEITGKITAFNTQIISLRINDAEYMASLSYEQYLEVAGQFCDMVLKIMLEADAITEVEAREAAESPVEDRIKMTASLIDKIGKAA